MIIYSLINLLRINKLTSQIYKCFCNSITKIVLKKPAVVETPNKKVTGSMKTDEAKNPRVKPKKKKKKTAGLNIPHDFYEPFSSQPSTSKGTSTKGGVTLAQLSSIFSTQQTSTETVNKPTFFDFI